MAHPLQRTERPPRRGAEPEASDIVRTGSSGHAAPARGGALPDADADGAAPDGVPFLEAMNGFLAAQGVDPVTRAWLEGAGGALGEAEGVGATGPGLSRAMFRFVMPHLQHPEVLLADNHRKLLEDLEARLLHADGRDELARSGIRVIRQELWRLASVRIRRNGLIEG